jgi:hypothetical protein
MMIDWRDWCNGMASASSNGSRVVLDYKRESTLLNAKRDRKNLPTSASLHSTYMSQDEPADGISAGDTQNPCEAPTETHGELRRGRKSGLFAPCALCVRRRERDTPTKELLDETMNAGRVDVEGEAGE